jgi:hypothetical protein
VSITIERLQGHVEITGVKKAEKDLLSFKAKSESIIKSMGGGSTDVSMGVDADGLRAEAVAAIKATQALLPSLKVDMNVDADGLAADRIGAARALGNEVEGVGDKSQRSTPKVRGFRSELAYLGRELKLGTSKVFSFNQAMEAGGRVIGLLKFPAMAAGIGLAAGGLLSLGSAVTALLGPLGSLVGLLGAIPGGIIAGAAAFAVGKLALGGIVEAIKERSTAEKAGAAQSDKYAIDQISNARQISGAVDSIRSSEHSLMLAQEAAVEAQKRITDARRDAGRQLFDLRLQTRQMALSEEQAVNSLADARRTLNDLMENKSTASNWKFNEGFVTSDQNDRKSQVKAEQDRQLAIRDATLQVRNAELEIIRIREDRKRQAEELADAESKGIERSDIMVDAVRGNREAQCGLSQAIKGVADAQGNLAEVQRQQALAATEAAKASAAATESQTKAYDKLTPVGKAVVDFYYDEVKPLLADMKKEATNAFGPGLLVGIKASMPFLATFRNNIDVIGGALGGVVAKVGELFGSAQWNRDFDTLFKRSAGYIDSMGTVLVNMLDTFKNLAITAKPVTDWMEDLGLRWSDQMKVWSRDDDGSLAGFFEKATVNADKFFDIIGNIYGGVKNVVSAAEPFATWILDGIVKATDKFEVWTELAGNKNKMADYFESQKAPLKAVVDLIGAIGVALFDLSNNSNTAELIDKIRTDLVPALRDAAAVLLNGDFTSALIDTLASVAGLFEQIGGSSGVLVTVVKVIGELAEGVALLLESHPQLKTFVVTMIALKASVSALSLVGRMTGLKQIGSALLDFNKRAKTTGGLLATLKANFGAMNIAAGAAGAVAAGGAIVMAKAWMDGEKALAEAKAAYDDLVNAVKTEGERAYTDNLIEQYMKYPKYLGDAGVSFNEFRGIVEGSDADFQKWVGTLEGSEKGFLGVKSAVEGVRDIHKDVRAEVALSKEITAEQTRVNEESAAKWGKNHKAILLTQQIMEKLNNTKMNDKYAEILLGVEEAANKARDAIKEFYDQTTDPLNKSIAFQAAMDELTDSFKENGSTLDVNTEAGRANMTAMIQSKDAAIEQAVAIDKASGSVGKGEKAMMDYAAQLVESARAAGVSEDEIATMIATMGLTPEQIHTKFVVEAGEAQRKLDEINRSLMTIVGLANTTIGGSGQTLFDAFGQAFGGGLAAGGDAERGKTYIVGEVGPEILRMDKSGGGKVIPLKGGRAPTAPALGAPSATGATSAADMEAAFRNALSEIEFKKVDMANVFPPGTDPQEMSRQIAWSLK